ncbi:MAG TPA: penicillin-binding protein 2 [Phototrophicaceae bacterium]|nr:penicillin-binding protein 2 [Phototrophicaceae bacterium]
MQTATYPQQEVFRRRLPIVIAGLVIASVVLLGRLLMFQFPLDPKTATYLDDLRDSGYTRTLSLAGARGNIYDRHGEALAVNTLEYRIGASPNLVADARTTATELSTILGVNELDIYNALTSDQSWVLIAPSVSADLAQKVRQLDLPEITMDSVPKRSYPQGPVAGQILGFVGGDLKGYYGVEGHYNDQLSGRVYQDSVSNIPFIVPLTDWQQDRGDDVVLTIDRDVQYEAESELADDMKTYGADGGTIIVENPRTGEILAMATSPGFDPNTYFNVQDPDQLTNPAISTQFEPGSIFKILTMAAALDTGAITPDFTYNDQGLLQVGGVKIYNWDRAAHGVVDATQVLVDSLNIGAATIALKMGPTSFYTEMDKFGIGRLTGIDLEGEQPGQMAAPGDENWSEGQFATQAFGQGVAVTPLQMITAASAIANGGLMMQPHVVYEIVDGDQVIPAHPANLGRPISAQTAKEVTDMMVSVVNDGLDGQASVPGYTIAGKTGTAQIATPIGYEDGASIASFIGFFPADDPQVIILVKLDRPKQYWGSETAAPAFAKLAQRLAIMLEIPTDNVRQQLAQQGGSVSQINR